MRGLGFIKEHRKIALETRLAQATKQLSRTERDVIPVVMDLYGDGGVSMVCHKFAMPAEATLMSAHHIARKHATEPIRQNQSLVGFVVTFSSEKDANPTESLAPVSTTLGNLHRDHASNDQNLYLVFCFENTFG